MIYDRFISPELNKRLQRPFVDIVFGARQTGKTCLLQHLLAPSLSYNLAAPSEHARLAAAESGNTLNYSKLSTEVGVSVPTIKSHYQLLEDMFVGFSVRAFSGSVRKNLLSTPRFLFFDVGVRHAASGITPGPDAVAADPGNIFEQWIGAELYRRLAYLKHGTLSYLRTKSGAEIDYIVELEDRLLPIEVKWTAHPTPKDARHLTTFIEEQSRAEEGFKICRCPRPQKMSKHVTAIPWHML